MIDTKTHDFVTRETGLPPQAVLNTLKLLAEGSTVPFIARYRKERTQGLDEMAIAAIGHALQRFETLEARKKTILAALRESGAWTIELERRILASFDPAELEDIYLPFRKKRKTRADLARERGLEPLARMILDHKTGDLQRASAPFLNKEVPNLASALEGARDILAEWFSEDLEVRRILRHALEQGGVVVSSPTKQEGADREKYRDYFSFSEKASKIPSHRYLAIRRGEEAGFLRVRIDLPEKDIVLNRLQRRFIKYDGVCAAQIRLATADGFDRLLYPSLENEYRGILKQRTDDEAIKVFSENLRQLLMAAPLGEVATLAVDPGFRTGCKVAVMDPQGQLKAHDTIYPHPPQREADKAASRLVELAARYRVGALAIGDGTAGRETLEWARGITFPHPVEIYLVSESGASIYSASDTAREEFPELDLTFRGSVSIGRRLMDPLAELVKIDPKSIGVGQYQHDVHQGRLREALEETTLFTVNKVGVQVNTASPHLLTHVAGIGPALARSIAEYRRQHGPFRSRAELRKVPRLGEKAFEQSAGFLRIRDGAHPLDNTAVHPERYALVERMAASLKVGVHDLPGNAALLEQVDWKSFLSEEVGWPTLNDIRQALENPGIDPRGKARSFSFAGNIREIGDLYRGMVLPGIVSNITNFGAFVNIGIKEDGLVHISNMADHFIRHPSEVLQLHQEVQVTVLDIDKTRKRIDLSLKGLV